MFQYTGFILCALIPLAQANTLGYTYDEAGNVKTIRRITDRQLSLSSFTPASGTAGTDVTLIGSGFNPNAGLNTVRFNGVAATVVAASLNRLIARAPAAASSGLISVTVGSSTVTSATAFTVLGSLAPPSVSSFTPTIGAAGTVITVRGMNFNPAAGATQVQLNQSPVTLREVDQTSLSAVVPANTGSGKLRVTTPAGSAESAEDFIVPPGNLSAASIVAQARVTIGGSQTLTINAANRHGVLLFDGAVGNYLTLDATAYSASRPTNYRIYKPDNTQFSAGLISAADRSIHLPRLPITGTYVIVFSPQIEPVSLNVRLRVDQTMVVDGATINETITFPGQTIRVVFDGQQGDFLGLGIDANVTTNPINYVYTPDGERLPLWSCTFRSCGVNIANLPVTGAYNLIFAPIDSGTGTAGFTLSRDTIGVLQDGIPFDVVLPRAGQNAWLILSATAGEIPRLRFTNVSFTGSTEPTIKVTIYRPDGEIAQPTINLRDGQNLLVDVLLLAQTGDYFVFIDPPGAATASLRTTIERPVEISVDGAGVPMEISTPDVPARLAFVASAGANLSFAVSDFQLTDPNGYVDLYHHTADAIRTIYRESPCAPTPANCGLSWGDLAGGTYSVWIGGYRGSTGTFTAWLSSDLADTLKLGTEYQFATVRRGQHGRLSFTADPGTSLRLVVAEVSMDGIDVDGWVRVFDRNRNLITDIRFRNGTNTSRDFTLPATDLSPYTVFIDPPYDNTVSMKVTVELR